MPILAGLHRRYMNGMVSDVEASLVEPFGVFDDDRQETAAHRDCEGVKEARLAANDVELRVLRLDKPTSARKVTHSFPDLVRQPGRSMTVFTAAVDQSEDRAEGVVGTEDEQCAC